MNKNAIGLLVKNQKATFDADRCVYFECPICKKKRMLVGICTATQNALDEIVKNPLNRLICMMCDNDIKSLNRRFNKLRFFKKRRLKKIYKYFGW